MKFLNEVRKEDDLYFEGIFWVIADSVEEIYNGNYNIISEKFAVDYNGNLHADFDKANWTHQDVWNNKYAKDYSNVSYKYYPRGRVVIRNGKYWINVPKEIYLPDIIDNIVTEFNLGKLEANSAIKKSSSGNHYEFELK